MLGDVLRRRGVDDVRGRGGRGRRGSDAEGGLLGARIEYVRKLCASDDRYVWLDQYGNSGNWRAHYHTTAPAIVRRFPNLDVLFVGTGTGGTLMGCARYLREWHRPVRIVAVDSVGSVTFGGPPGRRLIPGVGAGVRPRQIDDSYVDEVVQVDESETIRMCRDLAKRGFLFGGSTGTLVSGALDWLSRDDAGQLTAVAISPDLGERYMETIYANDWVREHYGEDVVADDEPEPDLDRVGPAKSRRARPWATPRGDPHPAVADVPVPRDRPLSPASLG